MSDNSHTPGPWRSIGWNVLTETESGIANCDYTHGATGPAGIEMDIANAARIVACVNACDGIDDPERLLASVKGFLRDMSLGEGTPNMAYNLLSHWGEYDDRG